MAQERAFECIHLGDGLPHFAPGSCQPIPMAVACIWKTEGRLLERLGRID